MVTCSCCFMLTSHNGNFRYVHMHYMFSYLNYPNGCPGIQIRNAYKHTCLHTQIFFQIKYTLSQLNNLG